MTARSTLRRLAACAMAFCASFAANAGQDAGAGCTGPNGSRFNLEPRPNALVQAARSVAFLPGRAAPGIDLMVATASDTRSLAGSPDAFYVERSNAACTPDFEGGPPTISNVFDTFIPFGSSTVIADPPRDAFFLVDLRFGLSTDENGIGIIRTTAAHLVEDAGLVLITVIRHALGVAPLRNRSLDDDSAVAGENAGDLALAPLCQEFDALPGNIADILLGSGYAGLGIPVRLWQYGKHRQLPTAGSRVRVAEAT